MCVCVCVCVYVSVSVCVCVCVCWECGLPVWDVEGESENALSEWPRVDKENAMPL